MVHMKVFEGGGGQKRRMDNADTRMVTARMDTYGATYGADDVHGGLVGCLLRTFGLLVLGGIALALGGGFGSVSARGEERRLELG